MGSRLLLFLILILGFLAQSRVIVLASLGLLIIKELELESALSFLSSRGIEIGLIILLAAILSSLLLNPLDWKQLKSAAISYQGIIAIAAGLLATKFNGLGLDLLQSKPQLIIGIILGSLLGIVFLGGIPVGPLMAAGIAAILVSLVEYLF